ncbi:MAG: metallophosphoesterase family protein [Kiritimatiellae bacterium]|nr:metallophosphoesterase family protein [Kiritimatiellia bacterium]
MKDDVCAILGDIHANLEALTAVLDDARSQNVTSFLCLGDVVGYNANPHECIQIVRSLQSPTVRGNHDHYCSHAEPLADFQPNAASVIAWTRGVLDDDDKAWLRGLPFSCVPMQGVTLVHGTLDMPDRWGYVFDEIDAEANFAYQTTPICFHGHTHVPVVFERHGTSIERMEPPAFDMKRRIAPGRRCFINVGSVGQPRDGDPRASYVIYRPASREIEFRRVQYDINTAAAKILKADLPERLAMRLYYGR